MTDGVLTRLARDYQELFNWTRSDDPERDRFTLDGSSLENTNIHPVSEAAANRTDSITIYGRIYPLQTAPNRKGLRIEMQVPREYPYRPPIVQFESRISHPNIDTLSNRWCTRDTKHRVH